MLRKANAYVKIRETCLNHTENQKIVASYIEKQHVTDQERIYHQKNEKENFDKGTLEKFEILSKEFERLELLTSKDNTKKNVQDFMYRKCEKPGCNPIQCQLTGTVINAWEYCR